MSLLSQAMEDFTKITLTDTDDGMGGQISQWVDGETITAAVVKDESLQARTAEKAGVTGMYTITTDRDINLQFHDVLRRESDGKIFRVLSDGDDKKTPASAWLNMRQVIAEEWEIPDE